MTASAPTGQILLEAVDLVEARYSRREAYSPGAELPEIDVGFEFQIQEPSPTRAVVTATFRVFPKEANAPFTISATFEVRASVESDANIPLLREFVKGPALSVLVPYFREIIANLSSRSGYPTLTIPPINTATLRRLAEATATG